MGVEAQQERERVGGALQLALLASQKLLIGRQKNPFLVCVCVRVCACVRVRQWRSLLVSVFKVVLAPY